MFYISSEGSLKKIMEMLLFHLKCPFPYQGIQFFVIFPIFGHIWQPEKELVINSRLLIIFHKKEFEKKSR